ncbi:creatininase family protein [Lachnospiraceae bacterium 54-53]
MVKYENVFMESIFADTMADMNWKEIEQMGQESVPVLFPLGVVEEHGPHLPLGTDIYMSYAAEDILCLSRIGFTASTHVETVVLLEK